MRKIIVICLAAIMLMSCSCGKNEDGKIEETNLPAQSTATEKSEADKEEATPIVTDEIDSTPVPGESPLAETLAPTESIMPTETAAASEEVQATQAATPETCLHKNTKWVTIQEATCRSSGFKRLMCCDCGKIVSTEVLQQLEHTAGKWIIDSEASCYSSGEKHQICSVCGATIKYETIKQLNHNYVNGVCKYCGDNSKAIETENTRHEKALAAIDNEYDTQIENAKDQYDYYNDLAGAQSTEYLESVMDSYHEQICSLQTKIQVLAMKGGNTASLQAQLNQCMANWEAASDKYNMAVYRDNAYEQYQTLKEEKEKKVQAEETLHNNNLNKIGA